MPSRAPIASEARALSYLALARMTARLRQVYGPPQATARVTLERMPPTAITEVATLFRATIPGALVARLGHRLLERFLEFLELQADAGVWIARAEDGRIVGFLCGVLDRPAVYARLVRSLRLPLLVATLKNAWNPAVLNWFRHALLARLRPQTAPVTPERPRAELLAMGVAEGARGQGVGAQLVGAFEAQLRAWGCCGDYLILTDVSNEPARRLYTRLGAREVTAVEYRGHQLVEFHKRPAPPPASSVSARPGTDAA